MIHSRDQRNVVMSVQDKLKPLFAKGRPLGKLAHSEQVDAWIRREFIGNSVCNLKLGKDFQNEELEAQVGLMINLKKPRAFEFMHKWLGWNQSGAEPLMDTRVTHEQLCPGSHT